MCLCPSESLDKKSKQKNQSKVPLSKVPFSPKSSHRNLLEHRPQHAWMHTVAVSRYTVCARFSVVLCLACISRSVEGCGVFISQFAGVRFPVCLAFISQFASFHSLRVSVSHFADPQVFKEAQDRVQSDFFRGRWHCGGGSSCNFWGKHKRCQD